MNSLSPATKHRYDITMSRRTRKQTSSEKPRSDAIADSKNRDNGIVVSLENLLQVKDGEEISDHKSLKQLIRGDSETNHNNNNNNKGRNSLGQHFHEEEKNLQVVRKNQNDSVQEGLKFKKLVRRYAKVLGHMMKAKRDPHLGESGKKPVFKLPK
ncbi:uncharacterized protein LOC129314808 [Prosopis cineraria]|uniref:uncharacterized protein LOC129314808 n=1 Tax=Prosopis cineraria TaxID=364024 RepID=UPI00241083F6|nr:uncharacterized protein LOC129314808 [Prosopis cineraria]